MKTDSVYKDQIEPSSCQIACRINTGQLLAEEKDPVKIRNRGLLCHCCCFITLKYAHFWHKTRLSLLITAVFPKDFTWCQGLWSSLCRSSTQITPVFLPPPLHLSLFPFLKCLSNFLVWEKRHSSIKTLLSVVFQREIGRGGTDQERRK